ncbi:IS3 family transposase [Burkholderia sp. WSM2232]|uniref:IS3 family transposase n=1 Tax=Burkholderia sp. WSM2232 TaxID=944436 RepID=UPI0018DD234B
MIDLPRCTYYYHPHSSQPGSTHQRLAALIDDVHDVFPGYGYRRVTRELAAMGIAVYHKRIARLCAI